MAKLEEFDLESVYDKKINPLMTQIIAICNEHNMPFVASFQYCHSEEEGPGFCSSAMLPLKQRTVAKELQQAFDIIKPKRRAPMMMLTTRDKDGNVTQMTAIVP